MAFCLVSDGVAAIATISSGTPFTPDPTIGLYQPGDDTTLDPPAITYWELLPIREYLGGETGVGFFASRAVTGSLPGALSSADLATEVAVSGAAGLVDLATAYRARWKVRFPNALATRPLDSFTYYYERAEYERGGLFGTYDYFRTAADAALGWVLTSDDYEEYVTLRGGVTGPSSGAFWTLSLTGNGEASIVLQEPTIATNFPIEENEWYMIEVMVEDDVAYFKMWLADDPEPTTWLGTEAAGVPTDVPTTMTLEGQILVFEEGFEGPEIDEIWVWGGSELVGGFSGGSGSYHGLLGADGVTINLGHAYVANTVVLHVGGKYINPDDYTQNPDAGTITLIEPKAPETPVDADYNAGQPGGGTGVVGGGATGPVPGSPTGSNPTYGWDVYTFLTRPNSAAIDLENVHGTAGSPYLINNLSFHDLGSNVISIRLVNCSYVRIQWCDFEDVAEVVYAFNSQYIDIVDCRYHRILGPHERDGHNRANFAQLNNCTNCTVARNKGKDGDTEDIVSLYQSSSCLVENNHFESTDWESASGSGIASGDAGGSYNVIRNNILVNPGQVGAFIASGVGNRILDNVIIGEQRTGSNVGIYVWNQYSNTCAGNEVSGNQVSWKNAGGSDNPYYNAGNCGPVVENGNNFGAALDPDDYRVTL